LVRAAVEWTIENKFVTKDIDPVNFYFTSTVGELIIDFINRNFSEMVNNENIELRKSTII
ncbi:MAG: 3-isopropylmalate dehydrogenase, partial [Ferruginibacter sp.]